MHADTFLLLFLSSGALVKLKLKLFLIRALRPRGAGGHGVAYIRVPVLV